MSQITAEQLKQASELNPSWRLKKMCFLDEEMLRPLALFRCKASHALQNFKKEGAERVVEKKELLAIIDAAIPEKAPKIEEAANAAKQWLLEGNLPTSKSWSEPETQAAMGMAILLNQHLPKDQQQDTRPIQTNDRVLDERAHFASMCQGLVGNKSTKIGFGPANSWFYFSPKENKINMDIGEALLLGLQNSKAILLHEIGHSQITLSRTPKQLALQKKLSEGSKKKHLTKAEAIELIVLEKEERFREQFFQYAEDCAVNIYAEIEGEKANNNITTAILRNYTVMGISRGELPQEGDLEKAILKRSNLPALPPTQDGDLKETLTTVAHGLPLLRDWVHNTPNYWSIVGCVKTETTENLLREILQEEQATSNLQPVKALTPLERLNPNTVQTKTKELSDKRNTRFDEIFDKYILPKLEKELDKLREALEKLPEGGIPAPDGGFPPPKPGDGEPGAGKPGEGEPGEGEGEGEGKGKPGEGEDEGKGKPGEGEGEGKGKPGEGGGEGKGKPGEGEDKDKGKGEPDTHEAIEKVLNDASEKAKKDAKLERDRRLREKQTDAELLEGIKASTAGRSIYEDLPEDCSTYADAVEHCQPQIAALAQTLRTIALQQKNDTERERLLLPDPKRGAASFRPKTYIDRRIKESSNQQVNREGKKHFERKQPTLEPAITNLEIYIDGSGSMSGENTKKTALTAIILNEASKRIPEVRIFVHFSGGADTEAVITPDMAQEKCENIIGSLLTTGIGRGSNEIDPEGLVKAYNDVLKCKVPPKKMVGNTHVIFLTDGGTCSDIKTEFQEMVRTILKNPHATFDMVITDASTDNNAEVALRDLDGVRPKQKPKISHAKTAAKICGELITGFTQQIRTNKSLAPIPMEQSKAALKKTVRGLEGIHI